MEQDKPFKKVRYILKDTGRQQEEVKEAERPKKKRKYKLKEDSDPFGKVEKQSYQNMLQDMQETKKKVEQKEKKLACTQPSSNFSFADPPSNQRYDRSSINQRIGANPRYTNYRESQDSIYNSNYKQNQEKTNRNFNRKKEHPMSSQANKAGNKWNPHPSCGKYISDSVVVQRDSHGLEDKLKKLKKLFMEEFKDTTNVKIRQSGLYPIIFFEYQSEKNAEIDYKHLRDYLKKLKNSQEKRPLFEDIFGRLFPKVPNKYQKMALFGIEKAKDLKFKGFNKEAIFSLEEGCQPMFYYAKGLEKIINFTIVDRSMRIIEFNSQYVSRFKNDHPDEFRNFEKFEHTVFTEEKEEDGVDVLNNEELSSDEDEKLDFQQKTIKELKEEVYQLLNTNTQEMEQVCEKKENEMLEEEQRDSNSAKFKKLEEESEDLRENLENFLTAREEVVQKLKKGNEDKVILKACLKKLILAGKQMESRLPIIGKKRKIFQMLKRQSLLIIQGETGSGKSTQLPQILCEHYELLDDPNAKPVLVTQPRRLATRSLAERVAKEMGETVGGFVDYVASASGRQPRPQAKIIFKLDRLVLDEITEDPLLSRYSCLVIDEAHERTISIDVILGMVKELLKKRKDFKVIVTSASMDTHLFESYFLSKTLKVSGRTYPVTISYHPYDKYRDGDKDQVRHKIQRVINEEILHNTSSMKNEFKGHLLCFCSSVDEIAKLAKTYSERLNKNVFQVFELHGKVTPGDQRKVFEETGKHKFIFASRIAQTAITIDGVRVVIDPGLDIELVYDQKYKVSSMKLQQITQSSAKQRAGRSGRTGPGHCFRLYSQENFRQRKPNKTPQIKNSSLETVVLRLKTLKIHDVVNFPYIEKPEKSGLQRSLQLLTLIGALTPKTGDVTKIGQLLIKLPIQPFLSRAIVEAVIFQKVLECPGHLSKEMPESEIKIIKERSIKSTVIEVLAMIINFSNLFFIRTEDREKGESNKYFEFSDQEGDFFFLDNIYLKFKQLRAKYIQSVPGKKSNNPQLSQWLRNNFLNFKALANVNELVVQVSKLVEEYRVTEKEYEEQFDSAKAKLRECKSFREIILSCLISSFSANLCKFSGSEQVGYTMVSQRRPIQIYGTSNLSLLGINADWIICYDLYTNEENRFYCKVAHSVTYDFMKRHIDKMIWRQFQIEDIQLKNPFYTEIFCKLPTRHLQTIKFDYYKGQNDPKYTFLRQAFSCITEETNTASFFLQAPDKNSASKDTRVGELKDKLNAYLKKLIEENKKDLRHNYIGNIYITFGNGFQVKQVEFTNKEFCVEVYVFRNDLATMLEEDSKMWGEVIVEDVSERRDKKKGRYDKKEALVFDVTKKRVKVFIQEEQNKINYFGYLKLVTDQFPGQKFQVKESIVDKRRKIPQTKIFLHYFAGTCQKNNVLISYSTYPINSSEYSVAEEMLYLIREGLEKYNGNRRRSKLDPSKMRLTKARNGINVWSDYDQYEILQEIYELDKSNLLGHSFKFPSFIKKFRDPEISEAQKTNDEWKEEILELLDSAKVKTENLAIDIRGHYHPDKKTTSEFERKLRVDMNATLTTLDASIYTKLKNAYDGKRGKLGCEKLHVRVVYEHVIAIISERVFIALQQEYEQFVIDYKIKYPLMSMEAFFFQTRNKRKVIIKARGPIRTDFLEPQRRISALFMPKLIKLEYSEFRFLDRLDAGNAVLDKIEEKYLYKIYFGMEKNSNSLKVYCQDDQLKEIEAKLKMEIRKYKYYSEDISYRGKNLNRVKEVLEAAQKQLKTGEELNFQIIFQLRKVRVTADLLTFERVKSSITKLSNVDRKVNEKDKQIIDCDICADILHQPYKLISCGHQFCWLCITDHMRAFRNSPNEDILSCPDADCLKPIAMQDAKTLLTMEQFEKICDIKIARHVEKNPDQYLACKYCEHIFNKEEVTKAGEVSCEVCGKCECLKCGDSHPNYTCDEWKDRDNIKNQLKKLNIKQCPQCKTGIEKNGGCNHMKCKNCNAHICWNCLKIFNESRKCYDHLAKECGGIFDSNHRQQ